MNPKAINPLKIEIINYGERRMPIQLLGELKLTEWDRLHNIF
jgi:hypothetical protein